MARVASESDADTSAGWVGTDVGGTFTDVVWIDSDGTLRCVKVPSTPLEPGRSTLEGIDGLRSGLENGRRFLPERIRNVHSSTIATNALIERLGARVGMVVTRGFRDLMELQRLSVPQPIRFDSHRPTPLVPRRLVREVSERIGSDGEELLPLDRSDVQEVARGLRSEHVDGVLVCFLNSYRNLDHEREAVSILGALLPECVIEASAEVWPQAREFERATLGVLNLYVRPAISRYTDLICDGTAARGFRLEPNVARSNGGAERAVTLKDRPVGALLSGPAAGVSGAAEVARDAGWASADLITLDVGGTSADLGIVRGGRPVLSTEEHVADFPVLMPTVAVSSIGAGGGSVIWADDAGGLRVGPRSLGADPGPACYGRQSDRAGLSDAFVLSGWLGDETRLGGKMALDADSAGTALRRVGNTLEYSALEVADGAVSIAIAMMVAETMRVLARRGVDAPDFRLVAYGGAGPLIGALLAEEVNITSVLIPPAPGALSALGAALADMEHDVVRPLYTNLATLSADALAYALDSVTEQAEDWLEREVERTTLENTSWSWSGDLRYEGQGYDVSVDLEHWWLREGSIESIAAAFHKAHDATYGYTTEDQAVRFQELRLHISGRLRKPSMLEPAKGRHGWSDRAERMIRISGQEALATIYARNMVAETAAGVEGPAIIEQMDTTTLVPPGWRGKAVGGGSLLLERRDK